MLEHYPGMGRKLVEDGRWELFELERALDGSRKELGGWGETRAVRSVPQGFVLQCFLVLHSRYLSGPEALPHALCSSA